VSDRVTGLLVPFGDRDALRAALLDAIDSPSEARARAATARSQVQTKFGFTTMVGETERILLEAQRAELESRLEAEETRIKDSRMRLNRVRNEREVMALRREIDVAKEANKLIEEQLLAVMGQLEELLARAASVEQSLG
jgi:hypothetical protein